MPAGWGSANVRGSKRITLCGGKHRQIARQVGVKVSTSQQGQTALQEILITRGDEGLDDRSRVRRQLVAKYVNQALGLLSAQVHAPSDLRNFPGSPCIF